MTNADATRWWRGQLLGWMLGTAGSGLAAALWAAGGAAKDAGLEWLPWVAGPAVGLLAGRWLAVATRANAPLHRAFAWGGTIVLCLGVAAGIALLHQSQIEAAKDRFLGGVPEFLLGVMALFGAAVAGCFAAAGFCAAKARACGGP